ncbi:hypothetical protein AC578_9185 [Pseudocercospora eumusae]|uniref:Uncharacterized protein n=1 Tax=Pseudocercospora eumusae TaxID=321146 RepID=A0A139HUW2_9PEZI|nr:hypothetical protein AC578_9185 [Pseudocercospora eumusae]KXT06239.1 hypothetical protein AC578_9185 [Pseudocercospora eumusae]
MTADPVPWTESQPPSTMALWCLIEAVCLAASPLTLALAVPVTGSATFELSSSSRALSSPRSHQQTEQDNVVLLRKTIERYTSDHMLSLLSMRPLMGVTGYTASEAETSVGPIVLSLMHRGKYNIFCGVHLIISSSIINQSQHNKIIQTNTSTPHQFTCTSTFIVNHRTTSDHRRPIQA